MATNIGEVVRSTETDFFMAACFDAASAGCMYSAACALKGVLSQATAAFLAVLDGVSLEEMMIKEERKLRGKAGAKLPDSVKPVALQFKPKRKAA